MINIGERERGRKITLSIPWRILAEGVRRGKGGAGITLNSLADTCKLISLVEVEKHVSQFLGGYLLPLSSS